MKSYKIRVPALSIPIAGWQDDAIGLTEPPLTARCGKPECKANELARGRFAQSGCSHSLVARLLPPALPIQSDLTNSLR